MSVNSIKSMWKSITYTIIVILVYIGLDTVIARMPEIIQPNPKEQLNTNFTESKLIFKFINANNISTIIMVVSIIVIAFIWLKQFKKEK